MLWGVTLVRLGVTHGYGAEMRRMLAASTKNRFLSFISGMGITALLQSSTATVLIVAGFAAQGMINSATGLGMVLGADVGTTLIAQIFSFDLSILIPLFMISGYIAFSMKNSGRFKNLGRVLIGLALMLFALMWIRESAQPLKESEILPVILSALQTDEIFAIAVAIIMTWLAHSSLAIVLLLMSFVASDVLPIMLAAYMVLGVNIGGTIAPILATLKDPPEALRIPVGDFVIRLIGVIAVYHFIPYISHYMDFMGGDETRQIVNFHTVFNLGLAIVFLPLTGVISRIARKIIPDRIEKDDIKKARYLNFKDLNTPSVALAAATRETLRMADIVQEMLEDTMRVFKTNDMMLLEQVRDKDDVIDHIYEQIKIYMAKLSQEIMDPKEAQRYVQVLTFSTNIEHAGDVIDKNLMPLGMKKIKRQINFSDEGLKEISQIHRMVMDSVQLAQSVFVSNDVGMAKKLIQAKRIIREAEMAGMSTHIERLGDGVPETIATSSLHVDIIRDYRRINSYMCTVAYPLVDENDRHEKNLKELKE